jgi:hypothetical protein
VAVDPVLPSDGDASFLVNIWVQSMARCDRDAAATFQIDSHLYGPLLYPQALCKQKGRWSIGDAMPFDQASDQQTYVDAFGNDVGSYTRMVPVSRGRTKFLAAVAPLGDTWRVVGVATARSERG